MTPAEIAEALVAPFAPHEVKFKPAVVSGNRALALAYADARAVMDRLDAVLGIDGWRDEYEYMPDGSVMCRLSLRLGEEWITKSDVGGQSEQPDEGDRKKAATSDALKRAAVKFGIGRYLYRLPQQWCDYDPQKRQFTKKPTLPDSAMPKTTRKAPPVPARASEPAKATQDTPAPAKAQRPTLEDVDAGWAELNLFRAGDLLRHVADGGNGLAFVGERTERYIGSRLARAGITWGDVAARIKVAPGVTPHNVTREQYRRAVEELDALIRTQDAVRG